MVRFYRLLAGVILASLILVGCVIPAPVVLDGSGAVVTRERASQRESESAKQRESESISESSQRESESASQRESESASQRESESASQRESESANQRISARAATARRNKMRRDAVAAQSRAVKCKGR
jgi:biopolymer transport protein ExbB/TolQ